MRRLLRSFFTAAAIAAAAQILAIGMFTTRFPDVVGRPEVQATRQLRLPNAGSLGLITTNGSVRVRTHDLNHIELLADIRIYSRVRGKTEALTRYSKSLIQVSAEDDALRIVTEPDGRAPYAADVAVDYVIFVPPETNLQVRGINGNIWISKGCGSVDVSGQNTDIEVADPLGHVRAKTTNGRVRVTNAVDGATIETVNGNVYVRMLSGFFSASTINGSIVARLLDPRVEQCRLTTQNGGITLVMRPEFGATVEAESVQGVVRCDLPIDGKVRRRRTRYLNARINSGDTDVRMESLNGNIWIARKRQ